MSNDDTKKPLVDNEFQIILDQQTLKQPLEETSGQKYRFTNSRAKSQTFLKSLKFRFSRSIDEDKSVRVISTLDTNNIYPNNKICTSKYTLYSFLPKNIWEQFQKFANIYFLIMGLLELIPEITTSDCLPIIYIPLSFILLLTGIKDFLEDWKRHKSDSEENKLTVQKAVKNVNPENDVTASFINDLSQNLRVGDIIKITQNQTIPADILLLRSSGARGSTYIQTKNLDGETNLKYKSVAGDFLTIYKTDESTILRPGTLTYESPNPSLYKFQGSFSLTDSDNLQGRRIQVSLTNENIVLRGCQLKNTKCIIGLVIYTGHETKILQNASFPSIKKAELQIQMNKFILIIVALQLFFCLFSALYNSIWQKAKINTMQYLEIGQLDYERHFWQNLFIKFFGWQMLLMNFIPISLLITLDVTRILQSFIIQEDKHLQNSQFKVSVQTSTVIEDLGQIQCVFSDKTGTITNNKMSFVGIWINGVKYGQIRELNTTPQRCPITTASTPSTDFPSVNFNDKNYLPALENQNEKQGQNIYQALMCLCTCHSIVIDSESQEYQSSSPDEIAFINFAKMSGYFFQGTDENGMITINDVSSKEIKYHLLQKLEFTSERMRMSVIVQDEQGNIILFTKGADSVIIPRLHQEKEKDSSQSGGLLKQLQIDLSDYGSHGLRTLVLAQKFLDPKDFHTWNERYEAAKNRVRDRDQEMERVMAELEKDFTLLGATAIEDELQEEAFETIAALKSVGIQFWVLTGDKKETAISVGYQIGVLNEQSLICDLQQENIDKVNCTEMEKTIYRNSAIVSGDFIEALLTDQKLQNLFIHMFPMVQSIIAYRVSPKQKREIVHLYKTVYPKIRTLAIGDGANDVNMITEAHVGVGIQGVEGMQAARSSDFAIGQFKHLRRLLFVHGRESYRKNADLINYNFYKNFLYLLPIFWYNINSGFSGISVYDIYLFQLFNLVYCDLPIFFYAVLDKEKSYKILSEETYHYKLGIQNLQFNNWQLLYWLFLGTLHTFLITMCVVFSINVCNSSGQQSYFELDGQVIFSLIIICSNMKVIFLHNLQIVVALGFNILSTALYYVSLQVFSDFIKNDLYDMISRMFSQQYFYLSCFLSIILCNVFDLAFVKYWQFQVNLAQFQNSNFSTDNSKRTISSQLSSNKDFSTTKNIQEKQSKKDKPTHQEQEIDLI